ALSTRRSGGGPGAGPKTVPAGWARSSKVSPREASRSRKRLQPEIAGNDEAGRGGGGLHGGRHGPKRKASGRARRQALRPAASRLTAYRRRRSRTASGPPARARYIPARTRRPAA